MADGMVFAGRGLRSRSGATEPALIDPSLRVDRRRPDWAGEDLFYWPSYAELSPAARAAYLTWLAGGRRHPNVPVGYVFLFFYGLERRVLLDALSGDPRAVAELPAIEREVRQLDSLYSGDSGSFRRYAREFLELLQLLQAGPAPEPPTYGGGDPWNVPLALRLGLAGLATERRPVPVDWALSWAWFHPEIHARTPQTRCRDEFVTLFYKRYPERHGDGLILDPSRPGFRATYYPASSGLLGADIDLHTVPDVLDDPAPSRALRALVEEITNDLDPYSRYIGRHPDRLGSLPASALLPADLVPTEHGSAHEFLAWARDSLGRDASVVVHGSDLIEFWPTDAPGKMSKKEAVACAQLLERHRVGLEPDVRMGGPTLSAAGPVVLFDTTEVPPRTASAEYTAATTLLQLAVAVAAADGSIDALEQEFLLHHLGSALELSLGEQERLLAHLHWLVASGPKLTGLTKRLGDLSEQRREATASLLVAVAAADGVVSPSEIKTLQKLYRMLGLDPSLVYSAVHERTAARADTPTISGRRHARGRVIASADNRNTETGPGVDLDPAALAAAAASTATVAALLGEVFEDPDTDARPAPASDGPETGSAEILVPGLDAAHTRLLRTVLTRATWSRGQFSAAAAAAELLPDGALDVLNDLAFQTCGEPLLEEDDADELELNDYAVQAIQEVPR